MCKLGEPLDNYFGVCMQGVSYTCMGMEHVNRGLYTDGLFIVVRTKFLPGTTECYTTIAESCTSRYWVQI